MMINKKDLINPDHYKSGKIEVIDSIESAVNGLSGFKSYLYGNAIKYLLRSGKKYECFYSEFMEIYEEVLRRKYIKNSLNPELLISNKLISISSFKDEILKIYKKRKTIEDLKKMEWYLDKINNLKED